MNKLLLLVVLAIGTPAFRPTAALADPLFGAKTDYPTAHRPVSVAIADVNGDGKADIAAACQWDAVVSVLLGHGDGTFGPKTDWTSAGLATSLAIGDLNWDGRPDVAATAYDPPMVSVLLGKGDGTFEPRADYASNRTGPTSVVIGDMNGDGNDDGPAA